MNPATPLPLDAAAAATPEALVWRGREAAKVAAGPVKRALARGESLTEQLGALAEGFAALSACEHARLLAFTALEEVPAWCRQRVRRYRQLLRFTVEDVLRAGSRSGEFRVGDPVAEAAAWLRLADQLPRRCVGLTEQQRGAIAHAAFRSLCSALLVPRSARLRPRPAPPAGGVGWHHR